MYYVVDEKGNKVEGYDKQGFLAVLQQAIEDGDLTSIDADSAFVSKLKCCVGGGTFNVAFVTQAKYNQLKNAGQLIAGALYFITDDETEVNLETLIAGLRTDVDAMDATIDDILDGTSTVTNATNATNSTNASNLVFNPLTIESSKQEVPITQIGLYMFYLRHSVTTEEYCAFLLIPNLTHDIVTQAGPTFDDAIYYDGTTHKVKVYKRGQSEPDEYLTFYMAHRISNCPEYTSQGITPPPVIPVG